MEVVASLPQGRTAAAQCGLFTRKSVPVIFEPPCIYLLLALAFLSNFDLSPQLFSCPSISVRLIFQYFLILLYPQPFSPFPSSLSLYLSITMPHT